jgi:asparagine synthase (glutamine-hydrolysing)
MCGILLTVNFTEAKFINALNLLKHRGPFNQGHKSIGDVRIGMTQLPMKQTKVDILPVHYQDFYIAYNGELYGKDLITLAKEADTLLTRIQYLQAINGMFAFAAYHKASNQIIIGRDEFGIKPIYYFIDKASRKIIVCSELLPILKLIGTVKVNQDTIAEILTLGTQASEATCFSGVKLLTPGKILKIDLNNFGLLETQLPELIPENVDLESLLGQAISDCNDSVREPSILLSEGLDSNLLLTYLNPEIQKFNLLIGENQELNPSNHLNLNQCYLDKNHFWPTLEKAIKSYAQPCRMNSILMYQVLSEIIKKYNTHLVITGEGADEVFWGYPRHNQLHTAYINQKLNKDIVFDIFFGNWKDKISLLTSEEKIKDLQHQIARESDDELALIEKLDKIFSMEPLLRRTDHLLMQNTIEARVPYLHAGIPYFARQLQFKKVNQKSTKYPLEQIFKKRNPTFHITAKKHFRAPIDQWKEILKLENFFTLERIEVLASLGIKIHQFKSFIQTSKPSEIFPYITLVIWHEQFRKYLRS